MRRAIQSKTLKGMSAVEVQPGLVGSANGQGVVCVYYSFGNAVVYASVLYDGDDAEVLRKPKFPKHKLLTWARVGGTGAGAVSLRAKPNPLSDHPICNLPTCLLPSKGCPLYSGCPHQSPIDADENTQSNGET